MTNEELVARIATGENHLIAELWGQVEKFVHWRAICFFYSYQKRCQKLSLAIDDLTQEGYFALQTAIQKFEPARGTKFLTLFDLYLKRTFFRMVKMHYQGWQNNTVHNCVSLNERVSSTDNRRWADTIPDNSNLLDAVEERIYWEGLAPTLSQALEALTSRQLQIISSLYYDGQTFEATAKQYGISRGAVSSIRRASMQKLRANTAFCEACVY